jgi:glutaredoxin-like protein NrdH
MARKHIEGETHGRVMLYTLSTCGWCKKTKALLNELKVSYDYADVDLLSKDEKEEVIKELKKWNPACSYPSIIIDDEQCIVGFKEDKIRKALGK